MDLYLKSDLQRQWEDLENDSLLKCFIYFSFLRKTLQKHVPAHREYLPQGKSLQQTYDHGRVLILGKTSHTNEFTMYYCT